MNGHVCITDFGLVKENMGYGNLTYTFCGSPEYLAPEILQGKGYGKAVDWWALGTFIYEMLTGLPPYFDEDTKEMNKKILSAPLVFEGQFSPEAKSLIEGLLTRDPNKRLGSGVADAEEIKKHPFFRSLDWKKLYNKQVDPPFKPHLRHALDVQNFESEFTNEIPKDSYVGESSLVNHYQKVFENFSYVAPTEYIKEYRSRKHMEYKRTRGASLDKDNPPNGIPSPKDEMESSSSEQYIFTDD